MARRGGLVTAVAMLLTACGGAAPEPAWPRSAGPQGDVDRSKPDAWQQDGGDSVDPQAYGPASQVEGARLGPPDPASELDEAEAPDDAGPDDEAVDGGEWVIDLDDLDLES